MILKSDSDYALRELDELVTATWACGLDRMSGRLRAALALLKGRIAELEKLERKGKGKGK